MSAYVVLKDTTKEAQEYVHDYVVTQGDDAAVQNILNNSEIDTTKLSPEAASKQSFSLKAGFMGIHWSETQIMSQSFSKNLPTPASMAFYLLG